MGFSKDFHFSFVDMGRYIKSNSAVCRNLIPMVQGNRDWSTVEECSGF